MVGGEGRREKGEGRREKGEGRREKGEGRREKGEGRREKGEAAAFNSNLRSLFFAASGARRTPQRVEGKK
jgi:hypothetical protein